MTRAFRRDESADWNVIPIRGPPDPSRNGGGIGIVGLVPDHVSVMFYL